MSTAALEQCPDCGEEAVATHMGLASCQACPWYELVEPDEHDLGWEPGQGRDEEAGW